MTTTNMTPTDQPFPYEHGLRLLQGKWTPKIISSVFFHRAITYTELRDFLKPISDTVLSATLRRLLDDEILKKGPLPQAEPDVEGYSLTEKGEALVPLLHILCRWSYVFGDDYQRQSVGAPCDSCPIRLGKVNPLSYAEAFHRQHADLFKAERESDAPKTVKHRSKIGCRLH